jgi:hypothetical protein
MRGDKKMRRTITATIVSGTGALTMTASAATANYLAGLMAEDAHDSG